MYYESGIFPILFTEETKTPSTDPGPIQTGGETPPPPPEPPRV